MICPVCKTDGQKGESCAQCGADLEIHRMLGSLQEESSPMIEVPKMVPTAPSVSADRRPSWWMFVGLASLNLLLVGGLLVQILRPVASPVASPVATESALRPAGAAAYFEEIHVLTGILKQALDAEADQRREISELRTQLKATAPPPRAAELGITDGKGQK